MCPQSYCGVRNDAVFKVEGKEKMIWRLDTIYEKLAEVEVKKSK